MWKTFQLFDISQGLTLWTAWRLGRKIPGGPIAFWNPLLVWLSSRGISLARSDRTWKNMTSLLVMTSQKSFSLPVRFITKYFLKNHPTMLSSSSWPITLLWSLGEVHTSLEGWSWIQWSPSTCFMLHMTLKMDITKNHEGKSHSKPQKTKEFTWISHLLAIGSPWKGWHRSRNAPRTWKS